jgi:hypothetical protein
VAAGSREAATEDGGAPNESAPSELAPIVVTPIVVAQATIAARHVSIAAAISEVIPPLIIPASIPNGIVSGSLAWACNSSRHNSVQSWKNRARSGPIPGSSELFPFGLEPGSSGLIPVGLALLVIPHPASFAGDHTGCPGDVKR